MTKNSASFAAMEARSVRAIPEGLEWEYEPKLGRLPLILTRDDKDVAMLSKRGQDLTRYFPGIISATLDLKAEYFVLDRQNRRAAQGLVLIL